MSISFALANQATKVDYNATSVADNGATIPIVNKPSLSAVATSGLYNDLLAKPTIPTVPTSVDYAASSSTSTALAITNKPVIPTTVDYTAASSSGTTLAVTNKPVIPSKLSQITNDSGVTVNPVNYEPLFTYGYPAGTPGPSGAPTAGNYGSTYTGTLTSGATITVVNKASSGLAYYGSGPYGMCITNAYMMTVDCSNSMEWRGFVYHVARGGTVKVDIRIGAGFGNGQYGAGYNTRDFMVNNTVIGQYNYSTNANNFVSYDATAAFTAAAAPTGCVFVSYQNNTSNGSNYWTDITFRLVGNANTTLYASNLNIQGNVTSASGFTQTGNLANISYGASAAPSTMTTLGSFGLTGTTPSVQTLTGGAIPGNGAGAYRFVQFWYYAASSVSVAAGDIAMSLNNTGSYVTGWEYVDPSLGFATGNLQAVINFDQTQVTQYPGFINLGSPTFTSPTNYTMAANNFQALNCVAFTLPAGWHEFRLYFQGNTSYINFQNSVSFSNCYAYPPSHVISGSVSINPPLICKDVESKRIVSSRMNVTGQTFNALRYAYPYYIKYNLITSFPLAAATAATPASSYWTTSNPFGATSIMQTDGTIKILNTGIYAVTLMFYFNAANQCQVIMATSDTGLGAIMFSSGQNAQFVNQLSWTGRIPAGTILTPSYYMGVAGNLVIDSRQLNSITIAMLYACT